RAESERESLRDAGNALYRNAFALRRLLADPLRNHDRALLLAIPAQERRAQRLLAEPDRRRTLDCSFDAEEPRLLHGRHRQVASRPRDAGEDGLQPAAAPRSDRPWIRLLLRHPGLSRHGSICVFRERSRGREADLAHRWQEYAARSVLARRRDR